MQTGKHRSQHGFTFMGLLALIAISGIAMAGVGIVWHQDIQREREKELLFIGEEYRNAIGSYYENTPSGAKQFPKQLEDLLLDKRFPNITRHIRKLYVDPMNKGKPWGVVMQQGNIVGVFSQSKLEPIKQKNFTETNKAFEDAKEYKDWKFIYAPGGLVAPLEQPVS